MGPGERMRHAKGVGRSKQTAKVWVRVLLTRAEIAKLQGLAAADFRSVGGYVSWLIAQEIERSGRSRRRRPAVPAKDRRLSFSIALRMPPETRDKLETRAGAEMRSVSNFVWRLIVEAVVGQRR